MKKILYFVFAFLFSINIAAATSFIEGLEDVPIMDELSQVNSDNISFGNEESRFVEVYLESDVLNFKKVESFYKDTLPQLGWTYQGNRSESLLFYRESESLEIARERKSPLLIRITVKNRA
ncbi:MAG: hypothetical protein LBL47_02370 [Lactobacillus sp.]|jgi:hypothetical protein|nr:hypothetical protein [Lactobacillus sp.]